MSKIYRRDIKVFHLAKFEHWKFKVNFFKNNLEICESNNQSNEENNSDSIISQINTNTDETHFKINDEIDTSEVIQNVNKIDIEQYDDQFSNETDSISSEFDDEIDESIEIESEDESGLDDILVQIPSIDSTDSNVATSAVNDILSTTSNQILNSDPVNSEKNYKSKIINQQNIHSLANDQQLENDSSIDCSSGSCVKEVNDNIVTDNSRSNISPESTDNSPQEIIQQSQNLNKIDNSIKESANNMLPTNINSEVNLQDDNNDNSTEEFILNTSYQQNIENEKIIQKSSHLDNTDNSIKKSVNIVSQISNIDINLQHNNNGNEVLNMNNSYQKSKPIQTTQQLPSEEEKPDVSIKDSINSDIPIQDSNTVVSLNEISNGTKELNMNNSYQKSSEEEQTAQQLPSVEAKTNISINESVSNIESPNSNTVEVKNDVTEQFNKSQQEFTNSDSLPVITEVDNQQVKTNNYIQSPLLEEKIVEINNENRISNDDTMFIGKNLNNEIIKEPVISETTIIDIPELSNDHIQPKSHNIHKNNLPNVESNISNNDSTDGNIENSSSSQELINATEIVPSNDYHTTVVNELDVTETLNKESIDQCTSAGCLQSIDSTEKYGYEGIQRQYKSENKEMPSESIQKIMEFDNNEQMKEFVPKSFVASFGHPEACSGVSCLNFKRNLDKTVKSTQPLNPVPRILHPDEISHSTNIDYEKEKENIINEVTEQSEVELSFLDQLQNWLTSPSLITIDFVWNIFGDNTSEYNGK